MVVNSKRIRLKMAKQFGVLKVHNLPRFQLASTFVDTFNVVEPTRAPCFFCRLWRTVRPSGWCHWQWGGMAGWGIVGDIFWVRLVGYSWRYTFSKRVSSKLLGKLPNWAPWVSRYEKMMVSALRLRLGAVLVLYRVLENSRPMIVTRMTSVEWSVPWWRIQMFIHSDFWGRHIPGED